MNTHNPAGLTKKTIGMALLQLLWPYAKYAVPIYALVVWLAFPLIPGITVAGGPVAIIATAVIGYVSWLILFPVAFTALCLVALCLGLVSHLLLGLHFRFEDKSTDELLLQMGEGLGYYKVIGLVYVVYTLLDAVALKIVARVVPGLTISGFLAALCGAVAINVACSGRRFIMNGLDFSKEEFYEQMDKLRRKVEAKKRPVAAGADSGKPAA